MLYDYTKNKADILSYFGYFVNRNFGENGV